MTQELRGLRDSSQGCWGDWDQSCRASTKRDSPRLETGPQEAKMAASGQGWPQILPGSGPVRSGAYAHSHILVLHSGLPSFQAALGSKAWFSLTDTHMHAKDTCRAHVFLPQHRDCIAATCQVLQCAALPPHAAGSHGSQPLCLGWGYIVHIMLSQPM